MVGFAEQAIQYRDDTDGAKVPKPLYRSLLHSHNGITCSAHALYVTCMEAESYCLRRIYTRTLINQKQKGYVCMDAALLISSICMCQCNMSAHKRYSAAPRTAFTDQSMQGFCWCLYCDHHRQWTAMFMAGAPELAVHSAAMTETPQATVTPTDQHALKARHFKHSNLPDLYFALQLARPGHSCKTSAAVMEKGLHRLA